MPSLCSIYDRATRAVCDEDRLKMFQTYVAKAEEYYGITKTRDIFERAIEVLPEKEVPYSGLPCEASYSSPLCALRCARFVTHESAGMVSEEWALCANNTSWPLCLPTASPPFA